MSKGLLATVIVILGCSGKGSSNGAGPVDPAAEDFCLEYANEVCRLAYLCTEPAAQDAAFHSRYGASMDDCWQGIEKLCTSNQSGSAAFGPSCGPGKQVNRATATTCTDNLQSATCATWMATPSGGDCQNVCGTAGTGTGTGTSTGTATSTSTGTGTGTSTSTGTGTGTSTGSVATPVDYCNTGGSVQCDRLFECLPADSAAAFGNIAGCKQFYSSECPTASCPGGFDPSLAAACVAAMKAATCTELMGAEPTTCANACKK